MGNVGADEEVDRWSVDGEYLFLTAYGLPAEVDRVDVRTGARSLVQRVSPPDPAGVLAVGSVLVSADAQISRLIRAICRRYTLCTDCNLANRHPAGRRYKTLDISGQCTGGGLPFLATTKPASSSAEDIDRKAASGRQHIRTFERLTNSRDWLYAQTGEWPLRTYKHQVSVTLAAIHAGTFAGSGAGWGTQHSTTGTS